MGEVAPARLNRCLPARAVARRRPNTQPRSGMRRRLEGKIAVVTGASSGVGRAIARAFGAEGASVALIARGRDGLEATESELHRLGARALVFPLDVSDFDAVQSAANEVVATWGGIDIWVTATYTEPSRPSTPCGPETAAPFCR